MRIEPPKLGLSGRAAARRELIIQTRAARKFERTMAKAVVKSVADMTREMSRTYENSGEAMFDEIAKDHAVKLAVVLEKLLTRTADAFGRRIEDAVIKAHPRSYSTKAARDSFRAWLERWAKDKATYRATTITNDALLTTRKAISKAFVDDTGITARKIANVVQKAAKQEYARWKAVRVAVTETHAASQAGQQQMAIESDLEFKREWVSAEDNRTRPSHSDADGQVVGMTEPFQVGGSLLMHPGDQDGPPKETINCRCVVKFVPVI